MAFDRSKVVAHANKYWDKPCEDGWVSCKLRIVTIAEERAHAKAPESDWEARFLGVSEALFFVSKQNPRAETNKPSNIGPGRQHRAEDCTHYVAECLSKGGISVKGITDTLKLVDALRARSDVKTLGAFRSRSEAERIMATGIMKEGDVIAYSRNKIYKHMGACVSPRGVTCHTQRRLDDRWNLDIDWDYTFLHFSSDSVGGDSFFIAPYGALRGWWMATSPGWRRYYFLFEDGSAAWTHSAPVAKSPPWVSPENRGYWFSVQGRLLIFWRNSAALGLEEFTETAPDRRTSRTTELARL